MSNVAQDAREGLLATGVAMGLRVMAELLSRDRTGGHHDQPIRSDRGHN
jgi:hypothetical protein